MSEIMKIIDKREKNKIKQNKKNNKKDRSKQRSGASYSETVRTKCFCCAIKLAFVQLICMAFFYF